MKELVTIIDYGVGNLLSVANAFEFCGAEVRVSDRYDHIANADLLVLPGVGAFANAMEELRRCGLDEAIKEFSLSERPFLGICLGMQMMLEWSEEFGRHSGLGLIEGGVIPVEKTSVDNVPHKIPHIGWAPIVPPVSAADWDGTILKTIPPESTFYFVHSFTAGPDHPLNRLADTSYNGRLISAVIRAGSMFGCQFHPEKSGPNGLEVIRNFLSM